jgi:hypothetical protein
VFGARRPGGIKRPRDVIAIAAFADDDEHVMHLTPVDQWAEFLDRVDDEAGRGVGVQRDRVRDRFAAVPKYGARSQGLSCLVSCDVRNNRKKMATKAIL